MEKSRTAGEKRFMERALELASTARGRTTPNPMVGAVLVKQGKVVGEGYHRRAGLPHAEVEAIANAGVDAEGADLYVNLEPCSHHGRTPPCTEAVQKAGIKRVFASMRDPNPLVAGRGAQILAQAGVPVEYGLLAEQAAKLNEAYLKFMKSGLPFVTLKCAMSLDGKIATRTGDSRWVSGEKSRREVHAMRDAADAVLVGIGTVQADDPLLTTRLPGGEAKQARRIVIDPRLKISEHAQMLHDRDGGTVFLASLKSASAEKMERLRSLGAEVLVCDGAGSRIDMRKLMAALAERGITSILIEGGSGVAASALAARVVDKVVFFIAPKIVGGTAAPTPVGGEGIGYMRDALELECVTHRAIGRDIVVTGYVAYRKE